jgi:glutathione S-transferase
MKNHQTILYYSPGSCSFAVHIALEEIGKPFTLEAILTDKGEARTPAFRRLNPKGRVPVLFEGGVMITEAPAILIHLALTFPEFDLAPKGNEELVRTLEWFNWLSGTVHSVAVRQIWRPEYFTNDPNQRDCIVSKGHEHLDDAYRLIDEKLASNVWAMPSGYTILDPYLLVFYRWGNRMGRSMRTLYPSWTAHAELILKREAVKRALAREEISVWQ